MVEAVQAAVMVSDHGEAKNNDGGRMVELMMMGGVRREGEQEASGKGNAF